jgi:hypothetical protein
MATSKIATLGKDIGLVAKAGGKFIGITWAAFGLMVITTSYWILEFRQTKKTWRGKFHTKFVPTYSPDYRHRRYHGRY